MKIKITSYLFDFHNLFRFATSAEKLVTIVILFVVFVTSFGIGLSVLIFAEYLGITIDRLRFNTTVTKISVLPYFGGGKLLVNATASEISEAQIEDALSHCYLCTIIFVTIVVYLTLAVYAINFLAAKQTMRIRKLFVRSILSQNMGWYDTREGMDFTSQITSNMDLIKDAIGEKMITTVFLFSTFIWTLVISFVAGWKLTLVLAVTYTLINVTFSIYVGKSTKNFAKSELKSYSVAGSIAEEVFNAIRTVKAFGGESKESQRYANNLKVAEESGIKKSLFTGFQSGLMWFLVIACFGAALNYGVFLMVAEFDLPQDQKTYNVVTILTIVMSMVNGSQFITLTIPSLETIASATGATKYIYEIIDRKSEIDPLDEKGVSLENLKGTIAFRNIHFQYPSRKGSNVLKGINFSVQSGQTVALVGHSGCGKTTCMKLLQRLYDPNEGEVLIDGVNVKDFKIDFLRSQIAVVDQEPVLFSTTIAENIRFGKPNATQDEIENSARIANCHNFIKKLPQGYDTVVGERGTLLSGGQKQRIAIARAIIRDPKILLLDEATSALDIQSEKLVQQALDRASQGRTTLIISHRFSSIRNADWIFVLNHGEIAENGTHEDLMLQEGIYYNLRMTSQEAKLSNFNDGLEFDQERTIAEDFEIPEQHERLISVTTEDKIRQNTTNRIIEICLKDWKLLVIGCVCSIIVGASFPLTGVLSSKNYLVFETSDLDVIYDIQTKCVICFFLLASVTGLAAVVQTYVYGKAGVHLTSVLRRMCFTTAMNKDISWYDHPKNITGTLSTLLSTDCANVQGATGSRLAGILQAFTSIAIGIIVGLIVFWKLTLVVCLTLPILLFVSIFESMYAKSSAAKEQAAMKSASGIATEAIMNIRTVASFGQEKHLLKKFTEEIDLAQQEALKSTRYRGLAYSLNMSMCIFIYGLTFLYGGYLISNGEISFNDTLIVIEAIIYGVWMMGIVLNTAPNVRSALISAANIMNFIDSEHATIEDQACPVVTSGAVEFHNITFRYPNRPESEILRGISFPVHPMKTVAIVGPSGCGKSTCIQLLLRFYDPNEGKLLVDGVSTTKISYSNLRSQIGLVSQEPVLFDCTIAENIAYGDNSRQVAMQEIIEAAKEAQIHNEFITKLPLGYETRLGSRGTHLSGGQKQRIAIARALIRKPKILLLDEATSALDAESEKTVQVALKRASVNRTCLIITHKLSSIKHADLICVIDQGKIAELGTHEDLIDRENGIYNKLYQCSQ